MAIDELFKNGQFEEILRQYYDKARNLKFMHR